MSSVMDFLIFAAFSSIFMNTCTASPIVTPTITLAPENAYPFIVSVQKKIAVDMLGLQKKYRHSCGGSLVTRKHVLTAAHCFGTQLFADKYRVIVGSNDLKSGQMHRIETWLEYDTWVMHNNKLPDYSDNDIAIAELQIPVDSEIKLAKITTASNNELRDAKVMTAGWGKNNEDIIPRYMLEANLNMMSHEQCIRNLEIAHNFTKRYEMDYNFFCTNGDPYALLNCGDSGSPVFWKGNEIIGINNSICPKKPGASFTKKEQNLHIDVRLYSDFITAVTDNCTIEENVEKPKTAPSCWPF